MRTETKTFADLVTSVSGTREGQHLEFKAADSLAEDDESADRMERLLREVVGFLNAKGGEILVGVGEREGCATTFEGVSSPERQAARLRDIFLDRIKPRAAIEIDCIPVPDSERAIIRIKVPPRQAPLHAYSSGSKFTVYQRFEDRLRPLTWDEVLEKARRATRGGGERDLVRQTRKDIQKWIRGLETNHRGEALWLFAAQPVDDVRREVSGELKSEIKNAIEDPVLSANRRMGWTFEVGESPGVIQGGIESGRPPGKPGGAYRNLRFEWSGRLRFTTGLESLEWGAARRGREIGKTQERGWVLYPHCVIEYPLSLLRLLGFLYGKMGLRDASPILVQTAFLGVRDSILLPGRPESPFYTFSEARPFKEPVLYSPMDPLQVTVRDLRDTPDLAAHRLISDTYEAFGHGPKSIPFFEPSAGRFQLPS